MRETLVTLQDKDIITYIQFDKIDRISVGLKHEQKTDITFSYTEINIKVNDEFNITTVSVGSLTTVNLSNVLEELSNKDYQIADTFKGNLEAIIGKALTLIQETDASQTKVSERSAERSVEIYLAK